MSHAAYGVLKLTNSREAEKSAELGVIVGVMKQLHWCGLGAIEGLKSYEAGVLERFHITILTHNNSRDQETRQGSRIFVID